MARYLIDVNLPRWFSLWAGNDYEFMHDIGPNWTDSRIWDFATARALTIVTKDADFSDRALLTSNGPRVIHIRVGNLTIGDLHYLSSVWMDVCRQATNAALCTCTGIGSKASSERRPAPSR
jgi:predicted nuclease of predicted toxin-antitoxin system